MSLADFNTPPSFSLFIVIVFHQTFEGLGLGSRLAFLPLPRKLKSVFCTLTLHRNEPQLTLAPSSCSYVPIAGALIYCIVTPIGMAIGLGVRSSYSSSSNGVLIASGVLDAISAGESPLRVKIPSAIALSLTDDVFLGQQVSCFGQDW